MDFLPSTSSWIIMFVISGLLASIEYFLYLAPLQKPMTQQIEYMIIDFLHCFVYVVLFYLFWNPVCDLLQLTVLNTCYLLIVAFFYYNQRCILTIFAENSIESTEKRAWINPVRRISSLWTGEYKSPGEGSTISWMNGNKPLIIALLGLNISCIGSHVSLLM